VETYRAVEVLTDLHHPQGRSWLLGSGFVLTSNVVLTAGHVLGNVDEIKSATIWVRDLRTSEWAATLRAYDDALDLAVLDVPGLGESLEAFPAAVIDREQARVVSDVLAVGFPGFKSAPEKPVAQRRQAAQVDGWIPTAENYSGGELVFKLRVAPPQVSPGSPWEGFSGAGVVVAGHLVGIAIQHRPSEGPGSLTVRPVAAIATLPFGARKAFEMACGEVDFGSLMILSSDYLKAKSKTALRVRIDRIRKFTRPNRSGTTVFGMLPANEGSEIYGEGAFIQATIENGSTSGVMVSSLDLVILAHDASFTAEYPVIRMPGLHLEVPLSVIAAPLHLNVIAELDGSIPVTSTQLALDPIGHATAHHTIDFGVAATEQGLWKLALRARYFGIHDPDRVHEFESDPFYVAKR
jgi:hypothetical protein